MTRAANAMTLGCVLAGGRSSRMGRDKALLKLGDTSTGRPLVAIAVEILRAAGCEVVIAGSRPDLESYASTLADLHPGCGPLAGVEAALAYAAGRGAAVLGVVFLPVDMPNLPASFVRRLLERSHCTGALATIASLGGRPQPLCAVYRPALLPALTSELARGERKVMRVLEAITTARERDLFDVESVLAATPLAGPNEGPAHRWFLNLNTPADLGEAAVPRRLPWS